PEPTEMIADFRPELRCYRDMVSHSPVAFFGEGPDNALRYEWRRHISYLVRNRRIGRLAADVFTHVAMHRRVPLLPSIPTIIRAHRKATEYHEDFPTWVSDDLTKRYLLRHRWQEKRESPTSEHPVRPIGYASLLT